MKKSKPLPRLPDQVYRNSYATTATYASTPSRFYVSDESFIDQTRAEGIVDVVSPDVESTPHLMSKSTVTYHPNHLEMLGERGMTVSMPDPLDAAVGNHSAVLKGLSPALSHSQGHAREPLEIEHYDIVGGWARDAFGKTVYVDHGTIDEEDDGQGVNEERILLPRQSSLESLGEGDGRGPEWELTMPLPLNNTPSSRPKPTAWNRVLPSFVMTQSPFRMPETVGGDRDTHKEHSGKNDHGNERMSVHSTDPPLADLPPEMMDLEMQAIEDMLVLVNNGLRDTKILRDHFIRLCAMFFLPDHIDVTYRVEKALSDVESAINRRKRIPQPHWDCRSAEWQQRYETRLISLRKTVQRLLAIRRFVDSHSRRPKEAHLTTVLEKLQGHERKYADIADKLHASFDRLKMRHLHAMLVDAYAAEAEAQKIREVHRRESFYRRRAEAKVKRDGLRKEFYAMRSLRGHSAI